jgi:hypothetical protein
MVKKLVNKVCAIGAAPKTIPGWPLLALFIASTPKKRIVFIAN